MPQIAQQNYQKSLQAKLIYPLIGVTLTGLALVALLPAPLGKSQLLGLLLALALIQLGLGWYLFQRLLGNRLQALNDYLQLIICTQSAPTTPLDDPGRDELARISNDLSGFIEGLKEVLVEVRQNAMQFRQGAQQLAQQMTQAEHAVDKSARENEQISFSLDDIAQSADMLSANASELKSTSLEVTQLLQLGNKDAIANHSAMSHFNQGIQAMVDSLTLLNQDSQQIGGVLEVIKSIAEQTNLLALNAAIEAARAGEQGRGFAVVADEVRALASRTQDSTKQIHSIVEQLQTKAGNAVTAIADSQRVSQESLAQSQRVTRALSDIGQTFSHLDKLAGNMSHSVQEQQAATASIHQRAGEIARLSQEVHQNLKTIATGAQEQKATSVRLDAVLKKVCV
jgi:methyl-accepting chemotaxis protein